MFRFLFLLGVALFVGVGTVRAETYRLDYDVAVLNVVVLGTASYQVTASESRYAVRANVRTSGLARLFDQTEINAATSGSVSSAGLNWSRYDISHAYEGKFRRVQISRGAGGVLNAQITPNYREWGNPPASPTQQRTSYDPLSALFALGRQVNARQQCRGAVFVFDGLQHYRLSVSGGASRQYVGGGYRGPALVCQFRYEPIAGFDLTAAERARIPVGEAIFALPTGASFAAPLRLSVPTPLGSAVVEVRNYSRTS